MRTPEKANTTQEKPVHLELCSKFFEVPAVPEVSGGIISNSPASSGRRGASSGNSLLFGGFPVHFATFSFPGHDVLAPAPPALPQGLGQPEEGLNPAYPPTSKGCFLINLMPHFKSVKQRESIKAVPC